MLMTKYVVYFCAVALYFIKNKWKFVYVMSTPHQRRQRERLGAGKRLCDSKWWSVEPMQLVRALFDVNFFLL